RHQRQHPSLLVDRECAHQDRLRAAGRQQGELRGPDRGRRAGGGEGSRMSHEEELRALERTLAGYRETLKEVNRLGGDGMESVRTEWLQRVKELELQREHVSHVVRKARRAAL